jgi:hypothetical protein
MPQKILHDDELERLEEDIRKLKNKYDQFFAGIQKFPPSQDRKNVEHMIYEIGKQKMRDNTRRFRYTTILTRFNQYREMWGRKMREREEGPMDFRRRKAALEAAAQNPPPPPPPEPPRVTSKTVDPYVKVAPGTNGEAVRRLYAEIEREHFKLGKLPPVTVEQLATMVEKQTEVVRTKYHVSTVAFRVETVDGKVKLRAKPLQE